MTFKMSRFLLKILLVGPLVLFSNLDASAYTSPIEIFRSRCDARNWFACRQLGEELARKKYQYDSEKYYRLACDNGELSACTLLGIRYLWGQNEAEALDLLQKGCPRNSSDTSGCKFLDRISFKIAESEKLTNFLSQRCDDRVGSACALLGMQKSKTLPPAIHYFRVACAANSTVGCVNYKSIFMNRLSWAVSFLAEGVIFLWLCVCRKSRTPRAISWILLLLSAVAFQLSFFFAMYLIPFTDSIDAAEAAVLAIFLTALIIKSAVGRVKFEARPLAPTGPYTLPIRVSKSRVRLLYYCLLPVVFSAEVEVLLELFYTTKPLLPNLFRLFANSVIALWAFHLLSGEDPITLTSEYIKWERLTPKRRAKFILINWNEVSHVKVFSFGQKGYRFFSVDGKRITLADDRPGFDVAERCLLESGRIDLALKKKKDNSVLFEIFNVIFYGVGAILTLALIFGSYYVLIGKPIN